MKRLYLSPPELGQLERDFVNDALDSNWIAPLGPHVEAFEREVAELVGVRHAVALASGTAALHLGLLCLGIGRGDKVLVSDLTFAATINAIRYCDAEPILIDCAPGRWNLDADLVGATIEDLERVGEPPAAVLAVDLYGASADYSVLEPLCRRHGVPLLEDAAEALGAIHRGRFCGSFGAAGAFSFNGNKIITTGGGGMLVSDDGEFIERARHLATQARDSAPHYQHSSIGYNYRLSNVSAALGRGQLRGLEAKVARRREIHREYQDRLSSVDGLDFLPVVEGWNGWMTSVLVDEQKFGVDRERLRTSLEAMNIEARPVWKPMHLQPVFERHRCVGGMVSEELFARGLCLPSGSGMSNADVERVVEAVLAARG